MVDPEWLARIRHKNQKRFDMAGMGGMGYVSSQDLVQAVNKERDLRTAAIHAGRLQATDPYRPPVTAGSVESITQNLGPVPQAVSVAPVSRTALFVGGLAVLGLLASIGIMATRRKSS